MSCESLPNGGIPNVVPMGHADQEPAALCHQAPHALEERRGIIENYYQDYVNLVWSEPEGHAMDYVHIYMIVAKI